MFEFDGETVNNLHSLLALRKTLVQTRKKKSVMRPKKQQNQCAIPIKQQNHQFKRKLNETK